MATVQHGNCVDHSTLHCSTIKLPSLAHVHIKTALNLNFIPSVTADAVGAFLVAVFPLLALVLVDASPAVVGQLLPGLTGAHAALQGALAGELAVERAAQ